MQWIDHESELRRAERYSDLSRSAFACSVIALSLVTAFTVYMFWPFNGG